MKRTRQVTRACATIVALVAAGTTALGCGSSGTPAASAGSDSTTTQATFVGKASAWLSDDEQRWNLAISNDKTEMVNAAEAKGLSNAAYTSGLRTACQYLLRDSTKAREIPQAPIAGLEADWDVSMADTKAVAESCLKLAAHQTKANFDAYKSDVETMDTATQGFNDAVQAAISSGH
jgi:uncharacterized ferredoxin-like protein